MDIVEKEYECCILGAGPAGFGTALELVKHGVKNIVIVDRNKIVGGLARTEEFGGARFDVGPHRFFTKNQEVNKLWHDTLGNDFKPVERVTRIFYHDKYFNYPLKAVDAFIKLGPAESFHAMLSFAAVKMQKQPKPANFEDWITQKFGRKLYETFFKTYTEKVWGIPCKEIGAEWAAQRIKGLDVIQVIKHSLFAGAFKQKKIKTLVEQFDYPVLGAGQMYEAMASQVVSKGAELMMETQVTAICQKDNRITAVEVKDKKGVMTRIKAKQFFTSIPITLFFKLLKPAEAAPVLAAAGALYFREHITVNLLVRGTNLFPDQWIYIHSPKVKAARLANYNNFSDKMSGAKNKTALSVEYFTFQHEELWRKSDQELKELAIDELKQLKLADRKSVESSWVVRETESYPTYYIGLKEPYDLLKNRLNQFQNLYPIGRGGLFKYNNQDHSTYSGMLAARNYLKLPGTPYDLWRINIDAEYLEDSKREENIS